MLRITAKSLWDHKRRLVSTLVAIVLGVAFMAGTFVLSDTMDQTFDDLFAESFEKVDAEVQGEVIFDNPFGGGDARAAFPERVLEDVRAVDGVAQAEPFVIVVGFGGGNRVLDKEGDPIGSTQGPPTLFENWYDNPDLTPYVLRDGRGPESDDEIALNAAAAEDGDYEVGDTVDVLTQFGVDQYELVGIVNFGSAESSAGAVSVEFTLAEAQRLAGTPGQLNQVVAKAEEGISQQELVDRIRPVLPENTEVITGVEAGRQLSSDVQSGFQFFTIALQVFGGIALLVGVFVISNTFSILVAQRTRELALLRAVGASRGQVLGSVLLEASLVGLVAAAVGLLAGVGLAQGVTAIFEASGADLPADTLTIRPATVVIAFVVGIGVTLIAALVPAIRSTRVPPLAALRDVEVDRSGASTTRVIVGVILLLGGLWNLSAAWRAPEDTDDLPPVGFGALLVIVAAIVIGPVLAGPSIRLLGAALPRLKGVTGRLAAENAARSPKRTSATASALLISVALVGFITVFASSAKASVGVEVSRGFEGDFVVQSTSGFFGPPSGFPPAVADTVAEIDGVANAVGFGFSRTEFRVDGDEFAQFLSGVDPDAARGVLDPRMVTGSLFDLTDDGVIVDVGEAEDHGIAIGDQLTITGPTGESRDFEVVAISDEENLLGYYAITGTAFAQVVPQAVDSLVFGAIEPGADLAAVLADIEQAIEGFPSIEVLDREGFIGDLAESVTQFVTIIYVMLALSVIIALIGIGNTLSLSIHERTRELGLLRAVGMNRSQLRSSIRWEAVLISVLGTLVGLGVGVGLSRAVLQALSSAGLTEFRLPVGSLVFITVLAAALAVLASIRPTRRASRLAILDAIAKQ
ncbi:MAG TPA: FtsX-like permease family protein [Acidimicrobiales bacterium]|nr:FtsX-like permease family protein [Acidimicrobiales bacterium]